MDYKLWIEQPENYPTCLATKPYPRDEISKFFKKFKLYQQVSTSRHQSKKILAGKINFSLPFLFIELPKWRCYGQNRLSLPLCVTEIMMKSIVYRGSVLWNKFPNYCQECSYTTLMTSLKDSDFLDTITNFSVYQIYNKLGNS